jgi:hypothetical protein
MNPDSEFPTSFQLRSFLSSIPALGAILVGSAATAQAGGSAGGKGIKKRRPAPASPAEVRRTAAYNKRLAAAIQQRNLPLPAHPANTDESLYPNFIGSFTKALPHNGVGEVDVNAYQLYRQAFVARTQAAFNAIPLGGVAKLANPQASLAFSIEGGDSHHFTMPVAPALASACGAGEMVEVYWRAWTRDVPFIEYASNPSIAAAASDLSNLPDFRGPKSGGSVTPGTIFRGGLPGEATGPLISQFLWKDIPFGAGTITQRYRTTAENDNHLTSFAHWLQVQNGGAPPTSATADGPSTLRAVVILRSMCTMTFPIRPSSARRSSCLLMGEGLSTKIIPTVRSPTREVSSPSAAPSSSISSPGSRMRRSRPPGIRNGSSIVACGPRPTPDLFIG